MGDPTILFIFTHFLQAGRGHHQPTFKVSAKESHCLETELCDLFHKQVLNIIEPSGSTCMFYITKYEYKFQKMGFEEYKITQFLKYKLTIDDLRKAATFRDIMKYS